MPTHGDKVGRGETGVLQYLYPEGYGDVLRSKNSLIRAAAEKSLDETMESIKNPEPNTVLAKVIETKKIDEDKIEGDHPKFCVNLHCGVE